MVWFLLVKPISTLRVNGGVLQYRAQVKMAVVGKEDCFTIAESGRLVSDSPGHDTRPLLFPWCISVGASRTRV